MKLVHILGNCFLCFFSCYFHIHFSNIPMLSTMEPPSESLGPPPSPFTAVASATIGALHRSPFIAFALKQLFKLQAFAPSSLSGQESRIMEELQTPSYNGQTENPDTLLFEDIDSTCSTPYVSAPSSPGRGPISAAGGGFFYSAPASPMHFTITAASTYTHSASSSSEKNSGCDFEFSARFVSCGFTGSGSMSSADELFLNGQIRPMKLSTHLERPQVLAPLLDLEEEGEENEEVEAGVRGRDLRLRDKSLRRRTRSLSPLRNTPLEWTENEEKTEKKENVDPSVSSGSGRSSKRWVFLRDFLRSKSEGRSNNKFWSTISFSPAAKDKKPQNQGNGPQKPKKVAGKPTNGVGKKRVPAASPHELHYKANRAQAEELRRKTFLPYRQGLLGCLGFSSKGYGAMSGFARALNPVSSR